MKLFTFCLVIILSPFMASAGEWCEWSGSSGVNCQSDSLGYVNAPNGFNVKTESILNSHGIYRLTVTQPTLGVDQTKDAVVWGLVGNQMSKTWTVRDLTATEIDQRDATPMPLSEYYLWMVLEATGNITVQQIQNNLPQELIDAYLARDRLENP